MNRTTPIRFLFGLLVALGVYAWYHYQETRSPEKIFTKAWGGMTAAHLGTDFGAYFEHFRDLKKTGQMYVFKDNELVPTSSFVEYFTDENNAHGIACYERRLKDLRKLNPGREAKPLVTAAMDLYVFMDKIHKTDFLRVVEMMDVGVPDEQMNAHLEKLMHAKQDELSEKYDALFELITAYGDKHGIKYSVN